MRIPRNLYGLRTFIEDYPEGREILWAIDFLPRLSDRLFWGYQLTTRDINRRFQNAFPGLLPDDIALSIIRGEIGGADLEKLAEHPF